MPSPAWAQPAWAELEELVVAAEFGSVRQGPNSAVRGTDRKPGKQPGLPGAALRQVEDPDEVVEHRLHKQRCVCGCVTTADAPAGVIGAVSYGPNLHALACYLVVFQHVPVERAAQLIAEVTGAGCSTG